MSRNRVWLLAVVMSWVSLALSLVALGLALTS